MLTLLTLMALVAAQQGGTQIIVERGGGYITSPFPIKIISVCSLDEAWLGSSSLDSSMSAIGTASRKFHSYNGAWVQERVTVSPGEEIDVHGGGVFIKGCVGFWFYTTTRDNVKEIQVKFYPDFEQSSSNYYRFRFAETGYLYYGFPDNRWWYMVAPPMHFVKVGSPPDWNDGQFIKNIGIEVQGKEGTDLDLWLGGIVCEDFSKAAITLSFDGVYRSAFQNALPLMDAQGWKGGLHVVGQWTWNHGVHNDKTVMTVAEVREYYNKGWDVIPHNWYYSFSQNTTEDSVRMDLAAAQKWAAQCGFYRCAFIGSPMGHNGTSKNPDTRSIAADYYVAARQRWRWDDAYNFSGHTNGFPYASLGRNWAWFLPDWYQIPFTGWHDYADLDAMKAMIDKLVKCNGMRNMFTHEVKDNPGPNDISIEEWQGIVEYIAQYVAQGKLEIITLTEYLDRTLFSPTCNASLAGQLAATPKLKGDLNGNRKVDFVDFAIMASNWLKSY